MLASNLPICVSSPLSVGKWLMRRKCGDGPADVSLVVAQDLVRREAGRGEVGRQGVRLTAPELEQQGPAGAYPARARGQDTAQDVEPLGPAVVGQRRLEREGVALEEAQVWRVDVWHDARDEVEPAAELHRDGREEVAPAGVDAVGPGAGHGPLVHVGGHD